LIASHKPRRGEIWTAHLADAPKRHWVVIVSLDSRNLSDRASSVLIIPFGGAGAPGPDHTGVASRRIRPARVISFR
jgi:hypothetical protein